MSQKDSFVKFEKVDKSYDGEILVVKDLNLDVPKGEFLTMLGPSGSGKTTVLMMLAGFETPTSGEIYLDGNPISSIPPNKRGIGMVFQNYALFPHMSVGENLAFPLEVRKIGKSIREEKIKRVLEIVKMTDFINRRPSQLSGGQQQRIALARSLVFEPELVLMDEPLGALDKQLREHMQYEIKHIHEQLGVTVVYVTHDQSEALTMSDRVAVFNEGVVQQLDTPVNIYEKPLNSFVAQFIGENNKLVGTIINENNVPTNKPAMITVPTSMRLAAPTAFDNTNGSAPTIIMTVVINMGLRRVTAACVMASTTPIPRTRFSLAKCVIKIPCFEIKPTKVTRPIPLYKSRLPPIKYKATPAPTIDTGTVNKIISGSMKLSNNADKVK